MYRKSLIPLLLDRPRVLPELASELELTPRELADDVAHLLRSLRYTDFEAIITPAQCRKCGFRFGADKLRKPGKCPQCHGSWIAAPEIEIRRRNG